MAALAPLRRLAATRHLRRHGSLPRVSEHLINLIAIDRDGERHVIKGLVGQTLLRTLIRSNLETSERHPSELIDSCTGNCEVMIANEWLETLPPRSPAEVGILRSLYYPSEFNRHSRLGCQIVLTNDLEGMTAALRPWRPWYTP